MPADATRPSFEAGFHGGRTGAWRLRPAAALPRRPPWTSFAALSILGALTLGGAPTAARECPQPSPEVARAELLALNDQYIEAALTGDEAWFRRHMADDVVVILGNGRRLGRDEFLAMVRDEPSAFRSLSVRDVSVRVFGAAAQVDADAPWELEDGRTGVSRYIDTYAWLGCRWQVVSAQITLLSQAAPR